MNQGRTAASEVENIFTAIISDLSFMIQCMVFNPCLESRMVRQKYLKD